MVDGVWCIDYLIKNVPRDVLLLDITTDAAGPLGKCVTGVAGRLGDCVHMRCAEGLRGSHFIQLNLIFGPH